MTTTLIIPGLNSSGSTHWQTWLESQMPNAIRVIQRDWKSPDLPEWSRRIRREIAGRAGPVLIAAHSFGALAAVQAAEDYHHRIVGALLVAPADPERFGVADMLPAQRLSFPATIVASTNDPWLSFQRALELAALWDAKLVDLGKAGHITADAGYGPWPFGLELLRKLGGWLNEPHYESADFVGLREQEAGPRQLAWAPRIREWQRERVEHHG